MEGPRTERRNKGTDQITSDESKSDEVKGNRATG